MTISWKGMLSIPQQDGHDTTVAAQPRNGSNPELIGVARAFQPRIVEPLCDFCRRTIDAVAIGHGLLNPWESVAEAVQERYDEHLFQGFSLRQVPEPPRFVFNSTNLQTGKSFRFSKPYMGDYRIGLIRNPDAPLSLAVTASSAFPPVLSPVILKY